MMGLRQEARVNRHEVAQALGVPLAQIDLWEDGLIPEEFQISAICELYKIPLEEFMSVVEKEKSLREKKKTGATSDAG